jgi:hypothetical protein
MILMLSFVVVWPLVRASHGKMSCSMYFVYEGLGFLIVVDL